MKKDMNKLRGICENAKGLNEYSPSFLVFHNTFNPETVSAMLDVIEDAIQFNEAYEARKYVVVLGAACGHDFFEMRKSLKKLESLIANRESRFEINGSKKMDNSCPFCGSEKVLINNARIFDRGCRDCRERWISQELEDGKEPPKRIWLKNK